jgi:hypothetical protein
MFGSYISFCVGPFTDLKDNGQMSLELMAAILNSPEFKGKY